MKNVHDVLRDTLTILEERGRCRGHMSTPDGRVCLLRAVNLAAGGDWELRDGALVALGCPGDFPTDVVQRTFYWNDGQVDDGPVVALLREAIAKTARVEVAA